MSSDFETLEKGIQRTLDYIGESGMEVPKEEDLETFATKLLARHPEDGYVKMLVKRIQVFIDKKEKKEGN